MTFNRGIIRTCPNFGTFMKSSIFFIFWLLGWWRQHSRYKMTPLGTKLFHFYIQRWPESTQAAWSWFWHWHTEQLIWPSKTVNQSKDNDTANSISITWYNKCLSKIIKWNRKSNLLQRNILSKYTIHFTAFSTVTNSNSHFSWACVLCLSIQFPYFTY